MDLRLSGCHCYGLTQTIEGWIVPAPLVRMQGLPEREQGRQYSLGGQRTGQRARWG